MATDENIRRAWEFVERTGVNVFLTGKAGTGKTTFLREVVKNSAKTAVVLAPTGVAAINAAGATIHSFFQLSPAPYVPGAEMHDAFKFSRSKLRIIRTMDLLIIDEISMVRADLLDAVDFALRKHRRDSRPFGGVQLLMIGDIQQLAPVVTPADEAVLRGHYTTPYFFGSHALSQVPYVTICLTKVYRQQNERFVELLNHVRDNCLNAEDRAMLNSRLAPAFVPDDREGYIRLTTHNHSADTYNESRLNQLRPPAVTFLAKVDGNFPESSYPTASRLVLKEGAQVMFNKNDFVNHQYYNGLIGRVVFADEGCVRVEVPGRPDPVEVTPQAWENCTYTINEVTHTVETQVQGTFTQMPLRLAWAITIHKSQGLTFDKVIIDAGASFAPGQVYVALSRCRSLEGMVLATPIQEGTLRPDAEVAAFIANQATAAEDSIRQLDGIKAAYYRQLLLELFTFRDIMTRVQSLAHIVYTTYRHKFPQETARLQSIDDTLRGEINDVSNKWIAMVNATDYSTLTSEPFLQRVRNGAVWFYNKFVDTFGASVKQFAAIKSENKNASRRVAELAEELRQAYISRLYRLKDINESGFTIANYLGAKQQAWFKATADPAEVARAQKRMARSSSAGRKTRPENALRQSRPENAPRKPRAPKGETFDITFRLFRQGLSREEIAKERGLAFGTITSHMERFIRSGEVTLEEVLTPVVANAISSAIQRLGPDATIDDLEAVLPGVPRCDIHLVRRLS